MKKSKRKDDVGLKQARRAGKAGAQQIKEVQEFVPFRFKEFAGIKPQRYIATLYVLIVLLMIYFLFLDKGLRAPQVQLQFYNLSGPASLYVDGKFYHNLTFSPGHFDSVNSNILLPVTNQAAVRELRVVQSGMEDWVEQPTLRANIWNNRWRPRRYNFELQLKQAPSFAPAHLWQEAWRAYLYRGLEGQKKMSFDASHPYPWVLSEGLRATLYSRTANDQSSFPPHWSADLQRGLASTTNVYQWGDLLSASCLIYQMDISADRQVADSATRVEILGPRSLALLARSAVKRLWRLEPGLQSLRESWKQRTAEIKEQGLLLSERDIKLQRFWQQNESTISLEPIEDRFKDSYATGLLDLSGLRFVRLNGQGLAVQQTELSNAEFAQFWFSAAGQDWRDIASGRPESEDELSRGGISALVLYAQDRDSGTVCRPSGWQESDGLEDILQNPLLQGRPVRGINWSEAEAYVRWKNKQNDNNVGWEFALPSLAQFRAIARARYQAERAGQETFRRADTGVNFVVSQMPPAFTEQTEDALGLKGLGNSLWEWLRVDYLPHRVGTSANGNSELGYKALGGGSWLNAISIDDSTRDLWADEFLIQDNELPVASSYGTVAGQFSAICSPYTGVRLVAVKLPVDFHGLGRELDDGR